MDELLRRHGLATVNESVDSHSPDHTRARQSKRRRRDDKYDLF